MRKLLSITVATLALGLGLTLLMGTTAHASMTTGSTLTASAGSRDSIRCNLGYHLLSV